MKSLLAFLIGFVTIAAGQSPEPASAQPVVFYSFRNVQLDPQEFTFQLSRDCSAVYTSKSGQQEVGTSSDPEGDRQIEEAKDQDEHREVRISERTCNSIFALAKSLGYFKGDFEFRKHKVAYNGDRLLGYTAPGVSNKTSFTWSENPQIQQLSALFEGMSATLEAEPKLKYLRRYDRLGLNETLKKLEAQARGGWLKELQLIAPELQSIADDRQVMNIARERARNLLLIAQNPPPSPTAKK
jgi:hypothetical protein